MPYSDPAIRRAEIERRLREETAIEEQRAQIRRTHAEREVEQRQQAIARRRALEEEAELARRQALCADCGLPEAAGLCPACSSKRRTEELVKQAVDLAVAVRTDLSDAAQVAKLTHQCERDTRALLAAACKQACGPDADPVLVAFTAPKVAQRIRDERHAAALCRLQRSEVAMAESDAVYDACLRRRGRGAEAAAQAADTAGRRTAEFLLGQLLDGLRAVRQSAVEEPASAVTAVADQGGYVCAMPRVRAAGRA
jgi:RNA polymerase subunit RPABC4/transcription elongation factor Spt4